MPACHKCQGEVSAEAAFCPHCLSERAGRVPLAAGRGRKWIAPTLWEIGTIGTLLLIAIAVVLLALYLPGTSSARPGARYRQSRDQLKEMGLALHNYHEAAGVFPPGGVVSDTGQQHHGWQAMLLPYLKQEQLYNTIDFRQPWDHPDNVWTFMQSVPKYLSPGIEARTDPSGFALSHYAANSHLFFSNSSTQLNHISDGTSQTLMAGEINAGFKPWGDPTNFRDPALGFNTGPESFGSPYPGGVNMLLMDGSVRFLSDNIDPGVLKALASPNGGESVGDF